MHKLKFPKHNSLPGRTLARLLNGQHLTHRSFQTETCSYRLSHFIWVLHEYGWPIRSIEKTAPTNDPVGRRATYSEYFFLPEDLQDLRRELNERLDRFIEAVSRFESRRTDGKH